MFLGSLSLTKKAGESFYLLILQYHCFSKAMNEFGWAKRSNEVCA